MMKEAISRSSMDDDNYTLLGAEAGNTVNTVSGDYLNATLDEVRFWNRAALRGRVCSLNVMMNLRCRRTGLIGYYKFNQGNVNANNAGVDEADRCKCFGYQWRHAQFRIELVPHPTGRQVLLQEQPERIQHLLHRITGTASVCDNGTN